MLEKAKECDALVLIDEAYYPYFSETAIDLIEIYDNLIITRTFSKACGLASMRLGYAVANPSIIQMLNTFRPIYETTGISALFGCKLLDNPDIIENKVNKVIEGREYVIREMAKIGLKTYPSHTNFIHIEVGEKVIPELSKYLFNSGILIKSGFEHKTLKKCIRISIGSVELMEPFVNCIRQFYMGTDL